MKELEMEPNVIRILAVVALVFLVAGDLTSIINPVLKTLGGIPQSGHKKTQPVRTSTSDSSTNQEEEGALNLLTSSAARSTMMATMRNSCLPKLICELNASAHKEQLTEAEKSLLSLIRDTSISMTAEVTSKYHFAAHMGQLIAGVDGTGCHNFYPSCPFPGIKILQMMKKMRLR